MTREPLVIDGSGAIQPRNLLGSLRLPWRQLARGFTEQARPQFLDYQTRPAIARSMNDPPRIGQGGLNDRGANIAPAWLVPGRVAVESQRLVGLRVTKGDFHRMKINPIRACAPVKRIPVDWKAVFRGVRPNLVGAASQRLRQHRREPFLSFRLNGCENGFGGHTVCRSFRSRARIALPCSGEVR